MSSTPFQLSRCPRSVVVVVGERVAAAAVVVVAAAAAAAVAAVAAVLPICFPLTPFLFQGHWLFFPPPFFSTSLNYWCQPLFCPRQNFGRNVQSRFNYCKFSFFVLRQSFGFYRCTNSIGNPWSSCVGSLKHQSVLALQWITHNIWENSLSFCFQFALIRSPLFKQKWMF